jgi:hypothetical protein
MADLYDMAGFLGQGGKMGETNGAVTGTLFQGTAQSLDRMVASGKDSPDRQAQLAGTAETLAGTLESMLDSKRQPKASDYMEFAKLASMPSFQEFLESHDQTGRLGNMTQRVLEKMNTHMYGATGQNCYWSECTGWCGR